MTSFNFFRADYILSPKTPSLCCTVVSDRLGTCPQRTPTFTPSHWLRLLTSLLLNWNHVLVPVYSRFNVQTSQLVARLITSPRMSVYVSAYPETIATSLSQQWLRVSLRGFIAIQKRSLICETFNVDCFCPYFLFFFFYKLIEGFTSLKSVSCTLFTHAIKMWSGTH